MTIQVDHISKKLNGVINLTSSKSISNRVLIIKALSGIDFEIDNLAEAKDTKILTKLLSATDLTNFDVGHAGTVMRFLTAFLSMEKGDFVLTGSERMQQRPIQLLVDALRNLGAEIEYLKNEGYPPLKIRGNMLAGGKIQIDGSVSSQYISALMLVAPYMRNGLKIVFEGKLTSKPYLEMTAQIMQYFGAELIWQEDAIDIKAGKYVARDFFVEADWSAASYWYGMAALAKDADVTLSGLQKNSLQGDSVVSKIYENFGVKTEYIKNGIRLTKDLKFTTQNSLLSLDFTDCPDIAQTVAVTCAAMKISAKFTGLHTLRIKETDRISALQTELNKLNYSVDVNEDELIILTSLPNQTSLRTEQCEVKQSASNNKISSYLAMSSIKTYDDHRMAMAFAPLGLLYPIKIDDEQVVVKSYPDFWNDLKKVGFKVV